MPRIIETVVYTIDELTDRARDAARRWYRSLGPHDAWDDDIIEDFAAICEILGIALATRQVPLQGGRTREALRVFWSGFSIQGDGASFEGRWAHARGSCKGIRAYAPKDAELHRIADALHDVQRRNFFQLQATITQSGRYCHEYTMSMDIERESPTWQPPTCGAQDAVAAAMRDLARWLHRQLEEAYDHLDSDTEIDEALSVNDFTFTADGTRFG